MKLVDTISRDILPDDVLWFTRQDGYEKPLRKMIGVVLDVETPEGEWDVRVSGAVVRVKHREIFGLKETEQD